MRASRRPGTATTARSASYPADGLCATVEVAGVPDEQQAGAAAYIELRTSTNEIELFEHAGFVDARVHAGTQVTIVSTFPYDSSMRFWRLRQQAGTSYWDTSSDGTVFTQQLAMPGFPVTTCQLELGAGAATAVTNGGGASFPAVTITGP